MFQLMCIFSWEQHMSTTISNFHGLLRYNSCCTNKNSNLANFVMSFARMYRIVIPRTTELSPTAWRLVGALSATATLGVVLAAITTYRQIKREESELLGTAFLDEVHRRSQQSIAKSKQLQVRQRTFLNKGTSTDDLMPPQISLSPQTLTLNPMADIPFLDIGAIRQSLTSIPSPDGNGSALTNHEQSEDEPLHERAEMSRNQSETKLDWSEVFEQHIKEDIQEAESLPIVIGEDIETKALQLVTLHIAKRLTRLFRKYSNRQMQLGFDGFSHLVKDYLVAAKVWVPRYIQITTLVKLRLAVAQLEHNAEYNQNKEKVAEKVSRVLAPYLVRCFQIIETQIDAMSQDEEVEAVCSFCFEHMRRDSVHEAVIDCDSFINFFPSLMESLFEFSKLIPAFRNAVSNADIDISLHHHIKAAQEGDDLLASEEIVERWIMALDEMKLEQYAK